MAKVLSLFDGMACGMIAMQLAGVEVESYDAYEIDKYAIKTAQHNFPMIKEHGDVFDADFTQYDGVDFLVGGSPCTYWSIAQTKNRETVASGMGWELFGQYVRALHEAKPKYFIYENNKSMSKDIRSSIDETFGFESVLINSALVSAQNRQRLYWVGKRNPDGTYSRVPVEHPEDRGILLRDILETGIAWQEKSYCITATEYKGSNAEQTLTKHRRTMVAEPINIGTIESEDKSADFDIQQYRVYSPDAKSVTLCGGGGGFGAKTGLYAVPVKEEKVGIYPNGNGELTQCQSKRIYSVDAKGRVLNAGPGGLGVQTGLYAVPVVEQNARCVAQRGRYIGENGSVAQHFEARDDGKTNTLTTVQKDNMVAVPVVSLEDHGILSDEYYHGGFDGPLIGMVETPMTARNGKQPSQHCRVYSCDDKYPCIGTDSRKRAIVPEPADGKKIPVYEVRGGQITIKGKQYPIKLADGFYIIRKLTVTECKRLQTVPDTYVFPVSDTQSYKMLGNGWTCEVIAHLIRSAIVGKA